jgi:hypothetical protein
LLEILQSPPKDQPDLASDALCGWYAGAVDLSEQQAQRLIKIVRESLGAKEGGDAV